MSIVLRLRVAPCLEHYSLFNKVVDFVRSFFCRLNYTLTIQYSFKLKAIHTSNDLEL